MRACPVVYRRISSIDRTSSINRTPDLGFKIVIFQNLKTLWKASNINRSDVLIGGMRRFKLYFTASMAQATFKGADHSYFVPHWGDFHAYPRGLI